MADHDPMANKAPRGRTDESLTEERKKTDQYLHQKLKTVEEETRHIIASNRAAADQDRDRQRQEGDLLDARQPGHNNSPAAGSDSLGIARERRRADTAQQVERRREDQAWARERFYKRLIAEALLGTERTATDARLFDERDLADFELHDAVEHLAAEQRSHAATRSTLEQHDQYLAIVSHDLKNSLVAVSLGTHALRGILSRPSIVPTRALANLETIEHCVAAMDRLVTDLLDAERIAQGKLVLRRTSIDLGTLVQECADLFAPVVDSKSFSVTLQHRSDPVTAEVDHDRLLQVLSNLMGNALKFTPPGGAVTLSVEAQETHVAISVADNGPGIPKEAQAHLFQRFSQVGTRTGGGLGLGLFIAHWIIQAHGGRIRVNSEEGRGTTMTFTVPLTAVERPSDL